jgi:hypothetical protein
VDTFATLGALLYSEREKGNYRKLSKDEARRGIILWKIGVWKL